MSIDEAVNAICGYLKRSGAVFALNFAHEAQGRYQVGVHQVAPQRGQRIFELAETDIVDCWEVTELQAA